MIYLVCNVKKDLTLSLIGLTRVKPSTSSHSKPIVNMILMRDIIKGVSNTYLVLEHSVFKKKKHLRRLK